MPRSRTVLVAGAGIGGLAAAIALSRRDFRVVVLERAPALEEIGAGIQLTPNATRALAKLGVLDEVKKRAVEARYLVVGCGETGAELARVPLGDRALARFGAPWLLTLRADLQSALHRVASEQVDIVLQLGTAIADIAPHRRGVTALTERGPNVAEQLGIAVIGADGLWSTVRTRLHGHSEPDFHHLVAWRALVPAAALPPVDAEPEVRLWLARDVHVVHYPVAGGESVNLVAVFAGDWREPGWSAPADPKRLPSAWRALAAAPRRVIGAASEFHRWALMDRPSIARWGGGRVTLLGDAAHPMLPFLAQGAAAAIEDAEALGRHLTPLGNVETALRAYERERGPRTARLQEAARFAGRAYHFGGIARSLRDFWLRWSADALIDRHAWIYRHGL